MNRDPVQEDLNRHLNLMDELDAEQQRLEQTLSDELSYELDDVIYEHINDGDKYRYLSSEAVIKALRGVIKRW